MLDRQRWSTREQLRLAIVTWIEKTYHRKRRQRRLGAIRRLLDGPCVDTFSTRYPFSDRITVCGEVRSAVPHRPLAQQHRRRAGEQGRWPDRSFELNGVGKLLIIVVKAYPAQVLFAATVVCLVTTL
ncbi:hypothetical protein BJD99_00395 [Rhodococcus sp. 1163]|nr:hypothetical protein BJD99_00395 [Rhodococcus sp. 1163]